ncbi:hypothetical protein [Streptomyces angustmyceticus]|uniref:hypothetical protein n=1 Tax=Streptomyces angustmyceticus TaxID=285578 RepID=UPI00381DA0DC
MNILSRGGSWAGLHSPQQLGEAIAAARAPAAEGGRHPLLTEWMTAPSGPGWTSSSRPGPAFLVEGIAARLPGRDATAGGQGGRSRRVWEITPEFPLRARRHSCDS